MTEKPNNINLNNNNNKNIKTDNLIVKSNKN